MDKGAKLAIKAAGGAPALAAKLRISKQAVFQWKRVPVDRVLEIERLTGIPRHVLRSDIYPKGQ